MRRRTRSRLLNELCSIDVECLINRVKEAYHSVKTAGFSRKLTVYEHVSDEKVFIDLLKNKLKLNCHLDRTVNGVFIAKCDNDIVFEFYTKPSNHPSKKLFVYGVRAFSRKMK